MALALRAAFGVQIGNPADLVRGAGNFSLLGQREITKRTGAPPVRHPPDFSVARSPRPRGLILVRILRA